MDAALVAFFLIRTRWCFHIQRRAKEALKDFFFTLLLTGKSDVITLQRITDHSLSVAMLPGPQVFRLLSHQDLKLPLHDPKLDNSDRDPRTFNPNRENIGPGSKRPFVMDPL